ncbi:hypothetical protein LV779_39080 [Streptomyces thinghirensis]|nr:hypothetical protein [Streptomyces thinghirensis]
MERVAEYYQQSGDADAKEVLDKWVDWHAVGDDAVNPDGTFRIPVDDAVVGAARHLERLLAG